MIPVRLMRHTRVRSLMPERNLILPCTLHRMYRTINSVFSLTVTDFQTNCSDLSLSVKVPLVKKQDVKSFTSETVLKCWNCGKNVEKSKFSCDNCGVLQLPNPDMTYFQLMDLPENFDLDSDVISNKYKSLQKMFHPDKFAQKSKVEKCISDDYSRLVNKAYSTLKNPLSRGLYMLNLKGLQIEGDSVKMNPEFLMEILEKNEEVENLNDEKAILEFQKGNSKVISEYVTKASKAFQNSDLQEAREILMKMKYFVNIENELKKKKSALGIVD